MELRLLTQAQLEAVYENYMIKDFPKSELPPLKVLKDRADRGFYECLGLYEDGTLRAYGHLARNRQRGYLLLDFLAVCREVRGGGYGSHFLRLLGAYYREEKGIFLECESERAAVDEEDWQVRHRRIHFYEKNGCYVTRTKELLFGVEFDILYLPIQEKSCQADVELDQIYTMMLGPESRKKHVTLWNRNQRMQVVKTWDAASGAAKPARTLLSALGFGPGHEIPRIVSLVGGGGKTSTMYQLADELAEQGKRVLVTTTTHIRRPVCEAQTAAVSHVQEIEKDSWHGLILTAGKPEGKKLAMPDGLLEEAELSRLLELADVILIEADGAKCLPIKVPETYEPVILPQTGLVIGSAGLSALGRPFEEVCFRFDTQGAWLRRSAKDLVEPEDLALILMDERGSHKAVAGRYYRVVLNQADGEEKQQAAEAVARLLPFPMQEGCAVTAYRMEEEAVPSEPESRKATDAEMGISGAEKLEASEIQEETELVICGGGHISLELSRLADFMDYSYTVMDDRQEFCNRDRFPNAKKCLCGAMAELLQTEQFSPNACYIIVTRGHEADLACLEQALLKPYAYVGMIGSRTKVAKTMEILKEKGFSEEALSQIHAPIGLKLGGQTPREIAVSIVAELIQVLNQNQPGNRLDPAVARFLKSGGAGVLLTIIGKRGSAPRGVGTRMVVCRAADGSGKQLIGTIGGGLMEAAAAADAWEFLNRETEEQALEKTYEINHSTAAALGMWCGGAVDIRMEKTGER